MYDLPTPNTSTTALASEATLDFDDDGGFDDDGEQEPLLGSTLRSKVLMSRDGVGVEEEEPLGQLMVRYTLCFVFVSMLGVGAWWINEGRFGTGGGGGALWGGDGKWGGEEWLRKWIVQILGWTSTVLYVCKPVFM